MEDHNPGDAPNKPDEGFCAITVSLDMEADFDRLRSRSIVVKLVGLRKTPTPALIARAIQVRLHVPLRDILVSHYHREDFLVEFQNQRQHDAALSRQGSPLMDTS